MALHEYKAKRDFDITSEPKGSSQRRRGEPIFVVQEHHASRLHYDFRLEADGVLKSWAVPKGPALDPAQKRLAVHVEDHPLEYAKFHGTIPAGQYGAGTVKIWDHGTYVNLLAEKPRPQSVTEGIAAGHVEVELHGKKLKGRFALVLMKGPQRGGKDNWLLVKMNDEFARPDGESETPKTKKPPPVTRHARPPRAPVEITHGDKLLFPDAGISKADVAEFYRRIADRLLPHLRDRPVTLERLPDGLGDDTPHFWQKNTPASYPDWIPRIELASETGKPVQYALVNDEQTLLYLVNQGTLTFHVWLSRVANLDRPDFVLFDLDPGAADFTDLVAVARELHEALKKEGHEPLLKTSGKTGLHVEVPWREPEDYELARAWAEEIAGRVVKALPAQATVERSKAKRRGRVYVDVMQNARGKHVVPPYVLRAVPCAPVSTPLSWRELVPDLEPARFNLKTIFRRLARQKRDPLAALLARGSS
jgi:bifunctional non-homologous end joining protein LigD